MATCTLKLKVTLAWWLMPYIRAVVALCWIFPVEPDMDRMRRVIDRGVRVRVDAAPVK